MEIAFVTRAQERARAVGAGMLVAGFSGATSVAISYAMLAVGQVLERTYCEGPESACAFGVAGLTVITSMVGAVLPWLLLTVAFLRSNALRRWSVSLSALVTTAGVMEVFPEAGPVPLLGLASAVLMAPIGWLCLRALDGGRSSSGDVS